MPDTRSDYQVDINDAVSIEEATDAVEPGDELAVEEAREAAGLAIEASGLAGMDAAAELAVKCEIRERETELRAAYEFLKQSGLAAEIAKRTQRPYSWLDLEEMQDEALSVILAVLPQNFLVTSIADIRKFKRDSKTESLSALPKPKRDLYHWTSREAFFKIMEQGFQRSTEVDESFIGTGDFEKHVGANGIFAAYAWPYEISEIDSLMSPLVVFPGDLVYDEETICIENELSGSFLQELTVEAIEYSEDHPLDLSGMDFDKFDTTESRAAILRRYILTFIFELIQKINLPEDIITEIDVEEGFVDMNEMSLAPESIGMPEMIFIPEDAVDRLYYPKLDQNPEFCEQVPIITLKSAREALVYLGEEVVGYDPTDEEGDFTHSIYVSFVEFVREGRLKIGDWRYMPESVTP